MRVLRAIAYDRTWSCALNFATFTRAGQNGTIHIIVRKIWERGITEAVGGRRGRR